MKSLYKTILVLVFVAAVVIGAVNSGQNKNDIYYYFQERHAVTFISALLLGMTSLLAFILSFLHNQKRPNKNPLNFWVFSCIGFFYLSLDEYFMMHEGLDVPLVEMVGRDPQTFSMDSLFFVILAIAGFLVAVYFWRDISRDKSFIGLCVLGTLCLGGMVVFDMLNQNTAVIKVIEESFKITGVTFFFAAFLSELFRQLT